MAKIQHIEAELEHIRASNPDGLLKPEEVVEFAKDPSTALHSKFEWDDSKAAHQHRLQQARQVIDLVVIRDPNATGPRRVYVNLSTDRARGGGYRRTDDVISDGELRSIALRDLMGELTSLQRKYKMWAGTHDILDEANRKVEALASASVSNPKRKRRSRDNAASVTA